MMYRCFTDLGVWPASAVVKVDDTAPGIEEALAAGSWAVGIAVSGNAVGLTLPQWLALSRDAQAEHRDRATESLRSAGAHEVIDTVADLPQVLDRIRQRTARGERRST
jgi:phosphonoacetaldehyde hydrolase